MKKQKHNGLYQVAAGALIALLVVAMVPASTNYLAQVAGPDAAAAAAAAQAAQAQAAAAQAAAAPAAAAAAPAPMPPQNPMPAQPPAGAQTMPAAQINGSNSGGTCNQQPSWPDCAQFSCTNGNWACTQMKQTSGMSGMNGMPGSSPNMGNMNMGGMQMGNMSTMPAMMNGMNPSDCMNSSSANFASQSCTQMRANMNNMGGSMPNMNNMQMGNNNTMPMPGMSASGDCWNSANTAVFASQGCTQMRASANNNTGSMPGMMNGQMNGMNNGMMNGQMNGMNNGMMNGPMMGTPPNMQNFDAFKQGGFDNYRALQGPSQQDMQMQQQQQQQQWQQNQEQAFDQFGGQSKPQQEMQLKQMKQGMNQMLSFTKQVRSMAASLKKKGYTIPTDIEDALTSFDTASKAVNSATTLEQLQDVDMSVFEDARQTLNEGMNILGMMQQSGQQLKQLDSDLSRLKSDVKRAVKSASKSKLELKNLIDKLNDGVIVLASLRTEVAAKIKTDPEAAFDGFEAIRDVMSELWDNAHLLEMANNVSQFLKEYKQGLKEASRTISSLSKQKKDVTELKSIVSQANETLAKVEAAVKAQNFDTAGDLFQDAADLRVQFTTAVNDLTNQQSYQVQGVQQLNSLQGFQFLNGGQQ